MILLACAVEQELAFWTARAGVERLVTGVGPVEAASAVAEALARKRYRLVVNAGIGGALDDTVGVGDGAIVAEDAFELALETGEPIVLPDGEPIVDRVRSDPELLARLECSGLPQLRGITVARVTSTDEGAARLVRLGAQIESMEGFAVLRAAQRGGVPAIELRGISNRCGARERSGWNFNAGIEGLRRALGALFDLLENDRVLA